MTRILPHPVIDDLGLDPGDGLPDSAFPLVAGWAEAATPG